MTKITKLEQKTYQGKPSGFTVGFDDGRVGNMEEKQSDKGLRVGDTVTVTEIPYTSKAGKTSTLYGVRLTQAGAPVSTPPSTPPPTPKPASGTGLPPSTPNKLFEYKAQASVRAMEFVINAYIADKLPWDQIKPNHKELTGYLWDAIDEINQG